MRTNTQIVQEAYSNFQKGNIQGIIAIVSEDVTWELPEITGLPVGGMRRGPEGIANFFSTLAETEEVLQFEPREFIAEGDQVVSLGEYKWRLKSTGKIFASKFAHVFTIRNGQLVAFREFMDTANAEKAAKN